MASKTAQLPPASIALQAPHQPQGLCVLLAAIAREVRLIRHPAMYPPAAIVLWDHHLAQEVCALSAITARVVPMIGRSAAPPWASTAPLDHHLLQELRALSIITASVVPLTSRVVPWATPRHQEVAVPQAASSNHTASPLETTSSYLR